MPPLFGDSQLEKLRNRILNLDIDVKAAIQQIAEFRGPLVTLDNLVRSCKSKMDELTSLVNEMKIMASEPRFMPNRSHIIADVEKHEEEHKLNLYNLRRVTLQSNEARKEASRAELFNGGNNQIRFRSNIASSETAWKQNAQVTDSLSGLITQMNSQVKQSEDNLSLLTSGSGTLTETEGEFHVMGGTIQSSGKLLSKYARREITDRLLLALCLLLFFGTCFYIVRKRLF